MQLSPSKRAVMVAATALNLLGAYTFLPASGALRAMGGLPASEQPLYLSTVAVFILIFGIACLWAGLRGRVDRQLLAVTAAGKLAFFALLGGYWLAGSLPTLAVGAGVGDLVFGAGFLTWLLRAPLTPAPDEGVEG